MGDPQKIILFYWFSLYIITTAFTICMLKTSLLMCTCYRCTWLLRVFLNLAIGVVFVTYRIINEQKNYIFNEKHSEDHCYNYV